MPDRAALKSAFLHRAGWGDARIAPLAGDASDRRYDRLHRDGHSTVLMESPPGHGDSPADFIRIARHLRQIGLSAPKVLADDLASGFLLLEDLGDALLGRCIDADPGLEAPLYTMATDVLRHLQSRPAPPDLVDLQAEDWADAAMLERRAQVAKKFLSGEWGVQLDGFEAARAADRASAGKRTAAWRD